MKRIFMNMGCRSALIISIVLLMVFMAGHLGTAFAIDKVTHNLSWLPGGSSSGMLIATDKGYYKDVGLEVKLIRGYGGTRTANELDQGMFEFGHGDPVGMVFANSKGGDVRMIGSIFSDWPAALCFIKERRNPKDISDLKGLVAGGSSYAPVHKVLPAWLKMNGFPQNHIKLIGMQPAVVDASLIEGKIDLCECWEGSNIPVLKMKAKTAGKSVGWIKYSDHKLNIYGIGIATQGKLIAEKPDLVRRYIQATYKGYADAMKDPEFAADTVVKHYPVLNRDVVLEQVRAISGFLRPKGDKPIGWMDKPKWENTVSFVKNAYALKSAVKVSAMYTNEFFK